MLLKRILRSEWCQYADAAYSCVFTVWAVAAAVMGQSQVLLNRRILVVGGYEQKHRAC